MQQYIGVKLIEARPMKLGEYNAYRGWSMPADEDPETEGYLVSYPGSDRYESWSPKAVFESAYFPLAKEDTITEEDVLAFVPDVGGIQTAKLGAKTAVTQARCLTGFEITESAACVEPENYDQNKGTQIGLNRIKDQLFAHLGFVLQWARNGLNA